MLKNCDNQFKFGQFRNKIFKFLLLKTTRFSLELRNHTNEIKNKPQDLLLILAVATVCVARNFSRGKQQPSFNI